MRSDGARAHVLPAPPADRTRAALWRHAGLRRNAEDLRPLLEDPYPVARLIAASCLAREESRGAHQRIDHPASVPELDHHHAVVGPDGEARLERWE